MQAEQYEIKNVKNILIAGDGLKVVRSIYWKNPFEYLLWLESMPIWELGRIYNINQITLENQ